MGGCDRCALPVQVPVSDLRLAPGRLSNGRRTVFIKDGYPSIGGGEKEWAKLLREVSVHILQVSMIEGPVSRLIGAAAAPDTQPD